MALWGVNPPDGGREGHRLPMTAYRRTCTKKTVTSKL